MNKISKIVDLKFTLSGVNKAIVTAAGEVPSYGWEMPELTNDRVEGDILHVDFLAEPPDGGGLTQQITAITAQRSFVLGQQSQKVTVHSEGNEMSVTLPPAGDQAE